MISLLGMASCVGVGNRPLSIRHDFFGYSTSAVTISVLPQVQRLQGRHVHMNVIRVGSDQFTNADEREIDQAVQFTRNTFAPAGLGVGRIQHFVISTAEANGRDVIDNDGEAEALTDEWTVPNDAMDIFFVRAYMGGTAGLSRVDGPCDKNAKGMDGSVVEMNAGGGLSDFALAHEAAHYLGLSHRNDGTALMNPTIPNGAGINAGEASNMRDHCFSKSPC
ncbi:MAG TPA: hypothetical protein VHN37_01985 [Actinomycetota bacterium]|nr:hypothetical protein [Actinomycetota bacterium]